MQQYPYSDNDMVYDYDKHRYILTNDCVKRELNLNLEAELNKEGTSNPANEVNAFLDEISFQVYNYIYSHAQNQKVAEYRCAKNPGLRTSLKDAMVKQVKYVYINGDIANESGIDFARGSAMRLEDMRGGRAIGTYTHYVLANCGLLYGGQIVLRPGVIFREDY